MKKKNSYARAVFVKKPWKFQILVVESYNIEPSKEMLAISFLLFKNIFFNSFFRIIIILFFFEKILEELTN